MSERPDSLNEGRIQPHGQEALHVYALTLEARLTAYERVAEELKYQVAYLEDLAVMLKDADGPLLAPLAAMFLGVPDARAALSALDTEEKT